jgi:hypothetical protein
VVPESKQEPNNREWETTAVSKRNDDDRSNIMLSNGDLCDFDMSQFVIHDSIDECDEVDDNDDLLRLVNVLTVC